MNTAVNATNILLLAFGLIGILILISIYVKVSKGKNKWDYLGNGLLLISFGVLFITLFISPEYTITKMGVNFEDLSSNEVSELESNFNMYKAIFLILYIGVGTNIISYTLTANKKENIVYDNSYVDIRTSELEQKIEESIIPKFIVYTFMFVVLILLILILIKS